MTREIAPIFASHRLVQAGGTPRPGSAPAGAPVARLARYAASSNEYKVLVSSRITGYSIMSLNMLSAACADWYFTCSRSPMK